MIKFLQYFLEKVKASKAQAGYVGHTVKGQACRDCTMWRPPNKCSAVAGNIKSDAWCEWWNKSKRSEESK